MRPPDPEAYGRVTNPGRYAMVVDTARDLVGSLVHGYDVETADGDAATDFPRWTGPEGDTIRLLPSRGVPLAFLFTGFPAVLVRFGTWGEEAFPSCGCDACDEDPTEVADRLTRLVQCAVDGNYREQLTRRWLDRSFSGPWGTERRRGRLLRAERHRLGPRGLHDWPPWPSRPPVGGPQQGEPKPDL